MNKIWQSIKSIDKLPKRTAMTLFGVIICAISVGIFKIAALGVDPFQSFMADLVIGVVIICFGSAFYMTADLGVSTYDAVALIIVNTWKKGKFQYVRIITDIVCVILGCVLFLMAGGSIGQIPTIAGIGTIITAFFMGPLIEFFNVHIARPILNK
ncbi:MULTISPECIES: hypothetical protein [unclassified Butyrivibrio]|uniref:hypothetical protein n=1 Tax=unclassified Butyrivibrio TaxID=2639466 RepID=UPI0003B6564D|nr:MULTISPECIES: hypothetical protein [unclassified Butyrivibrio]